MRTLSALVAAIVFPLVSHSAESVSFASLGTPAPLKFASGEMVLEVEGDALVVTAPNFWTCGWQVAKPVFPVSAEGSDKPLVIVGGGSSANDKLVLRMRLVSRDWSRADFYDFSLSGLSEGDGTEFVATTVYGTPAEQENGGLAKGEDIGAMQFLFRGKGKSPIRLNLQKILLP